MATQPTKLLLDDCESVNCPICDRQLFVTTLDDGKARFDGCGCNCLPVYWVPKDSIIVREGRLFFLYRRKWKPDDPKPTLVPKYTGGAW